MLKEAWDILLNRDVRHITFGGYPVHEPLQKHFWRSAHFKAACVAAIVPAGYAIWSGDYLTAPVLFGYGAMSYGISEITNLSIEDKMKNELRGDLCIDKNGKLAQVTGSAENHARQKSSEWVLNGLGMIAGLSTVYGIFAAGTDVMKDDICSGVMRPALFSMSACSASLAYRFFKVSKGDWAIVKMPPKQEVRQEEKVTVPGAVPEVG